MNNFREIDLKYFSKKNKILQQTQPLITQSHVTPSWQQSDSKSHFYGDWQGWAIRPVSDSPAVFSLARR